jgi:hypothetical protein
MVRSTFQSSLDHCYLTLIVGSHTKGEKDILLEMQETLEAQSLLIQEWQGFPHCLRQEKIWCQAKGLWWLDQTHLQKEGKDHKESHIETWMLNLQKKEINCHQEMQDFHSRQEGCQIRRCCLLRKQWRSMECRQFDLDLCLTSYISIKIIKSNYCI